MTANDNGIPERVSRLEASVAGIVEDVREVRDGQTAIGRQIDELAKTLTSTDGKVAERAAAVKHELREEAERKARERSDLLKNGAGLVTVMALIVAAFCGPYLNKLNATADGQATDMKGISELRELVAADHAQVQRNSDALEIARDKNRWQDDHLFELVRAQAFDEGAAGRTRQNP